MVRGAELKKENAAARSAVISTASVRVMRGLRAVERTTSSAAQRSMTAPAFPYFVFKKEKQRTF